MSASKHIDRICLIILAFTLIITALFMCSEKFGVQAVEKTLPYAENFFDTSYVHSVDIVMEDWDSFIENCESEEYSLCTVVIDGTKYRNVAIRAKGNTSLSSVAQTGNDRYSFKLEFDHYDDSLNMDGLDKLCLNNLIQDNTMMKDYIVYTMMNEFGVDSPLCCYAYIRVNGEDWGLYLAVEGVEDSFLERNYSGEDGELYKPDSLSFGGGRGNGKNFSMDNLDFSTDSDASSQNSGFFSNNPFSQGNSFPTGMQNPSQGGTDIQLPDDFSLSSGGFTPETSDEGTKENSSSQGETIKLFESENGGDFSKREISLIGNSMGSDDVKLKYIDDDISSYSNIFDNAKTAITDTDKQRLIQSLKSLSSYSDLENTVDIDEVMRYFVVHNFVCNGDSYTGSMIHNYYLYENEGVLSMIPWDYNLAFGTFSGSHASGSVNEDIDNPVSNGSSDDRPMLGWIFSGEEYTQQYHQLFEEFIDEWFRDNRLNNLIESTAAMIQPYVQADPTKFCTTAEFEKGVEALSTFVALRAQSVRNQLEGNDETVSVGSLNVSDMGSMGSTMNDKSDMSAFSTDTFDISRFISLRDVDGNEIELSDLLDEGARIVSAILKDGSILSLSDSTVSELMKIVPENISSLTDDRGKKYDLSSYTISISIKSSSSDKNDQSVSSSLESQDNKQDKPQSSSQFTDGKDNMQIPNNNTMPSGDRVPTFGNQQMHDGEQQGTTWQKNNRQEDVQQNTAQSDMTQFSQNTGSGTLQSFILLGASAAILLAGIVVVSRKRMNRV